MQLLKKLFFVGYAIAIGACAGGGSSGSLKTGECIGPEAGGECKDQAGTFLTQKSCEDAGHKWGDNFLDKETCEDFGHKWVLKSTTGGGSGGDPVIPDGHDNVIALANVEGADGVSFGTLHVTGGIAYACTGNSGMQVASANSAGILNVLVGQGEFEMAKGCRELASSPDGTVFVSGQGTEGGAWIGALSGVPSEEGIIKMSGVLTVEGALVEELIATDTHVFAVLGDKGLRVYGRNDGQLAEVGRLSEGLNNAMGVTLWKDGQLVVANGLDGLAIVDVSEPSSP
jgi:hypothetical protein